MGRQATGLQGRPYCLDDVAAANLNRREIDRHRERVERRDEPASLIQNPRPDRNDQTSLFGHSNESRLRYHAPFRVHPTQQRLDADGSSAMGGETRLEMQDELAARDCGTQIEFQASSGADLLVHLPTKEAESSPAIRLGLV